MWIDRCGRFLEILVAMLGLSHNRIVFISHPCIPVLNCARFRGFSCMCRDAGWIVRTITEDTDLQVQARGINRVPMTETELTDRRLSDPMPVA